MVWLSILHVHAFQPGPSFLQPLGRIQERPATTGGRRRTGASPTSSCSRLRRVFCGQAKAEKTLIVA